MPLFWKAKWLWNIREHWRTSVILWYPLVLESRATGLLFWTSSRSRSPVAFNSSSKRTLQNILSVFFFFCFCLWAQRGLWVTLLSTDWTGSDVRVCQGPAGTGPEPKRYWIGSSGPDVVNEDVNKHDDCKQGNKQVCTSELDFRQLCCPHSGTDRGRRHPLQTTSTTQLHWACSKDSNWFTGDTQILLVLSSDTF